MRPVMTHLALQVRDLEACIAFYRDYCGMEVAHEREAPDTGERIVWLAEPGREKEFIFVILPGGRGRDQAAADFSHFGFALASRTEVDAVAEKARRDGILVWEPREEPYPVGYHCGVKDPDGNFVEFSYGQPLGPGAQEA